MREDTNELIRALRRQDASAQHLLLTRYGDLVFRHVTRIVAKSEDAEEVYQDVFVKAFSSIDSYDERQASLATWLCRIAHHESLNFVRQRRPHIVFAEDGDLNINDIQDDTPPIYDESSKEQTIQLLDNALQELPPDEQALIAMFYFDGLGLKEIAYITDSIPSTIGSKLCRIRKKLYRTIQPLIQ